jgi:hypothetical protein
MHNLPTEMRKLTRPKASSTKPGNESAGWDSFRHDVAQKSTLGQKGELRRSSQSPRRRRVKATSRKVDKDVNGPASEYTITSGRSQTTDQKRRTPRVKHEITSYKFTFIHRREMQFNDQSLASEVSQVRVTPRASEYEGHTAPLL